MIGRATVLLAALCMGSAGLHAQTADVTVTSAAADVRSAPSLVNPVVGRASRGMVLGVTRDVGDWYKVIWPAAKDGIGYVRRSDVALTPSRTPRPALTTPPVDGTALQKRAVLADLAIDRQPSALRVSEVVAPSHALGVGVLTGRSLRPGPLGFGVTGRAWPSNRIGVQVELARRPLTTVDSAARATATSFAPSLLVPLPGHLSDFVWFRPYVGAGGHLTRTTLTGVAPVGGGSTTSRGLQTFGGGELTLAAAPQLAFSADVGYRWNAAPAVGFGHAGPTLSVAAHWYVR